MNTDKGKSQIVPENPDTRSVGSSSASRPPTSILKALRILLVEDNPGDVRLVHEMLRDVPGMNLEAVGCLVDAVSRLASGGIDMVLLDLGLPDSGGLETLTSLMRAYPAIPVVAWTGTDDDELALAAVQAGAQDFLTKRTMAPEVLRRTIRHAIERKSAEEALKLNTAMLRNITEGINLVGFDDGIIKYVNPRFEKMFGYDASELVGKDVSVLNAPAAEGTEETRREIFNRLKQTGEWHGDIENIKKDGTRFWCHVNVSLVDDYGFGRVCISAHTDITERKRAEEEVRLAHAFLDGVINAIADPVFVKDDQRRFVLFNDALCTAVGRPREGLIGKDGDDMFPKDQVAVFRQMDAAVLDTGTENVNEEALSNLSSGEVRTIVTRKTRYVDPAGKRFLVGVIRDISERKRAEEAVRESEARFATVFRSSPMAIAVTRLGDGRLLDVNPAWQKMTGYARDEVVQQNPIEPGCWVDPNERDRFVGILRKQGAVHGFEFKLRRKSGEITHVLMSGETVRLGDEDCALIMAVDITERRRAEEQMATQLAELRRWHDVTLHREDRVAELKREVNELGARLGEKPRYGEPNVDSGGGTHT